MNARGKKSTGSKPFVLAGKLRPPQLRHVLVRQRLLHLAGDERGNRVTIISGGPGYGKTTLMAHMAKQHSGLVTWYQVDSLDEDPVVFLSHLIQGIAMAAGERAPDLGERAAARLQNAADVRQEGESILAVLVDEMAEKIRVPLLVCLDDYHLLAGSDFANSFISYLAQKGPDVLSLMLTSRTRPRLPLGRLRSQGKVVEIGESELRFSLGELQELLETTWGMDLSRETIHQLHDNTEGWAASLVLVENLLKRGEDVPALFAGSQIKRNIYEYLAEEILNRQPERLRDFLMKSSLIDPVDPDICHRALGIEDAPKMLDAAVSNNLFTSRIEDTELYRFHPMFREFLSDQLREADKEAVGLLHVEYAKVYESDDNRESAIEHYFAAGAEREAVRLIKQLGGQLISSGKFTTLDKWLSRLRSEECPAVIDVYRGEVLLLKGNVVEAKELLEEALPRIEPDQTAARARGSLALAEAMNMLFLERDAVRMLKPLLELDISPSDRLEVLIKLGICLGLYHQLEEAEQYLVMAEDLARKERSSQAVLRVEDLSSFIAALRGDFHIARAKMEKSIDSNDQLYASRNSLLLNRLAGILVLVGDYQKAEVMALESLARAEDQREVRLVPYALETIGWIKTAYGNFHEGEEIFIDVIDTLEEVDISGACETICHLGTTYRRMNRFSEALEQHSKCILIAEKARNVFGVVLGTVNRGADLLHLDQFNKAVEHFDRAERLIEKHEAKYFSTQIDYQRAWIFYMNNDKTRAADCLTKALGRAKVLQHNHFIIQESRLTLPLITVALENEIESDYVFWILERMGDRALPALEPLITHDNEEIRQRVAGAIGKVEASSSLALLRRMTRDDDKGVRLTAQSAIDELRPRLKTPTEVLTPREDEVLRLIAEGLSNGSIGQRLFISERTVKTHVSRIFQKLGLTNRLEAALFSQNLQRKNTTFRD